MLIRNENIKFTGNPININFGLSTNHDFLGYEQELNTLIHDTGEELINNVVDTEIRRFQLNGNTKFTFYFYSNTLGFGCNYEYAGFKSNEITGVKMLNSFYVLDFYDTFDTNTQTKIFRTYLTQLVDATSQIPEYEITGTTSQLYKWGVPISYINKHVGEVVTGYVRILFYNASNGAVVPFYNLENQHLTTPEKMYFKTFLDINNHTWQMSTHQSAYQLVNPLYNNKLDKTVQGLENRKQNYSGATGSFDSITRTYA